MTCWYLSGNPNLINNLIASALSITPILSPVGPPGFASSGFNTPNDPNVQISTIDAATASSAILQYPLDRGKYFMSFDIFEYSRESLTTLGHLKESGYQGIVLPLPQQLIDKHDVSWTDKAEIGILTGNALNNVKPIIAAAGGGVKGNLAGITTVVGAEIGQTLLAGQDSVLSSGLIPGAEALLGLSPNQFMTVLFVGPQYKRHSFSWNVSPHNKKEAEVLRQIVKTFNNAMSPNLTAGGAIWTFPKIFKMAFFYNCKFLFKFKPAVLTSLVINYSPGGRPAFYRDTAEAGENAPEGMTINAQFLELEYWLEGNYNDSDYPQDVYDQAAITNQVVTSVTDFFNEQFNTKINQPTSSTGGPSGSQPKPIGPQQKANPT